MHISSDPAEFKGLKNSGANNSLQTMDTLKLIISSILKVASLLAVVFLGAGRLDYWQGWGLVSLLLIVGTVGYVFFKKRPELMKERAKPGKGMKWWDKVFWAFNVLFYLGVIVVGVLDGGRFIWTELIPLWGYILSYIAFFVGVTIVYWGMWTNNYFSSVVRIQKDRGQKVVTDGPYKIVRHPGYVGASIMMMSIGPILGSLWAMIPGGLWVISIIIRTYMEDITLQKELDGYKEYTKKTRYRLIPGIWSFLICLTILTGCVGQQQKPVEWLTYEGPWFDIEYPSNFSNLNEEFKYSEEYDGAIFINEDKSCIFYVYSPQWAGKSIEEEMYESETLLSEKTEGNTTKRKYFNNNVQFLREVEIIEENDATVRYMFYYGHAVDSDICRPDFEQFKGSLIQYAD